jgi:hypothetical protein
MDEQDWVGYRKRLKARASRQLLLIIAPIVALVAVLKILAPMDHPVGDIRNSIEFRLVFYGLFIAFSVAIAFAAVRWLRADQQR